MQNNDDEVNDLAADQDRDEAKIDSSGVNPEVGEQTPTGAPQLSMIELRVLGVLMEKQLTTPDQYPLTLNSVITACNQKSSREPISNYNQGEVHRALQILNDKHFIRRERSSRSEKFSQQFIHHLELGRKQQAILCVMMLRGPQSISELNTRTQRMCEFSDKDELEHCIDRLCNRDTPYAIRLGQQPGQRGERIGHLFNGTPKVHSINTDHNNAAPTSSHESNQSVGTVDTATQDESIALLELEVATLTENYNALKTETIELKQQMSALYALTGHVIQS